MNWKGVPEEKLWTGGDDLQDKLSNGLFVGTPPIFQCLLVLNLKLLFKAVRSGMSAKFDFWGWIFQCYY